MNAKLFIPPSQHFHEIDVWKWYQNLPKELELLELDPIEHQHILSYYHNAGLFQSRKYEFFRRHYSNTFYKAAQFLLQDRTNKVVLDLGSGTGTQALFFALQGAQVIALVMDSTALEVLRKRKILYENQTGLKLKIEICEQNAFNLEIQKELQIDAVWSMFAFNMMQPSDILVDQLLYFLSDDARISILDGNNSSWLSKFIPSRRRKVWSPEEFNEALNSRGFKVNEHFGGIALPPLLWYLDFLQPITERTNNILCKSWLFPISHQIMATRQDKN